jgi:hypothetical protein
MINHEIAKSYLGRIDELTFDELADAMTYKWFRMNTLYHIKDKNGKKVLFKANAEQESFYINQHCRDIILKARQLGFTTWKMISDLDDCLFTPDFAAGCICHNLEDAKDIFRNKIKFAYQNITQEQRELIAELGYDLPVPINDKDNGYVFNNGSSIKVSVSYRGGTLQSLHVSEFGKICKKYPEKAKEIVTGAFESVAAGNTITIESTAEGREGYFYEYCKEAERRQKLGDSLSVLDFNFHFFPWYLNGDYAIEPNRSISDELTAYFDGLESRLGIEISEKQRAWYAAKESDLGEDMKREYPSTPKEAFEQSLEGAYYARQFTKIYKEGRICEGFNNKEKVNTAWDLGVGDSTAIWFYQKINNEIHLIDYYENSGEGLDHYFGVLKKKGYDYGRHYGPHDIDNRSFENGGRTRKQIAADGFDIDGHRYKVKFQTVPRLSIDDGIQHVRKILDRCVFDKDKCEHGVKCLESYRKEWNDKLGCYRDRPLHDWASHGADAFRYMAIMENKPEVSKNPIKFGGYQ